MTLVGRVKRKIQISFYLIMMRILLATFLVAFAFACAHQDPGKNLMKSSAKTLKPEDDGYLNDFAQSQDSSFYIGYVDYFPETKEFYTNLYYKKGHEYPDEELLESKLDSVIVLEDDWGRERLPMEEAKKLLVLSGLDTVFIYNRQNHLVCTAALTRVEYLWNGLESFFVGVFKSDSKFLQQTEELYGVSAGHSNLMRSSFASEEIHDEGLNKTLIEKLHLDPALEWDMRHFRMKPENRIYSVLSFYSMDSNEGQSYLTSYENNDVKILNREINNYHFLNILPLPIEVNGKPLLLISAGYPSSDVLWDFLAGFDGTGYQAIDYNRIDPEIAMTETIEAGKGQRRVIP